MHDKISDRTAWFELGDINNKVTRPFGYTHKEETEDDTGFYYEFDYLTKVEESE